MLAAAAAAVVIPPSGPWNVEAAENLCLLSRKYGEGTDKFLVGFQPVFDQQSMELILIDPARVTRPDSGTASVTRAPDGKTFKGDFFTVGIKNNRRFTRITLDRAVYDGLGDTQVLTISAGRIRKTIGIGRFEKARQVFQDCERDLLKAWSVDPADLSDGRGASYDGSMAQYFRSADYPPEALSKGYIGRITAVLNIDTAGKVTNCRPVAGAGTVLNAATCARAALIPFKPGKNANGEPAPSIFILSVQWKIGYGGD